jgi:hypothetical protein
VRERDLYLASDAALRDVIHRLTPENLDEPAPADWSNTPDPSLRDILAYHAFDEAWVPDVLAGRTIDEVGDAHDGDLLGADPIAGYNAIHDRATAAARQELDPRETVHLSYGDFTVAEFFVHIATYRAFQAWSIAKHVGIDYSLPDDVVDGLNEFVMPNVEMWRSLGVFPPEVEPPADADAQTLLLCRAGYWKP